MFRRKIPEKPKTQKAQINALWDFTYNHLWTKLNFLDWKVNFLMLLVIALLTVVLMK